MSVNYKEQMKQLTKLSIEDAFFSLLKDKEYSKITVTMICNNAGVSRMAFYRHYSTQKEIVVFLLDRMFEEFLTDIQKKSIKTKKQIIFVFLEHFKSKMNILKVIFSGGLSYIVAEQFIEYLNVVLSISKIENTLYPKHLDYQIEFTSGGLYRILVKWINSDCDVSVNEMSEFINTIIL